MPKKFEKIKTIEDFTLKNNFKPNFEHDLILQDVQKLYFTPLLPQHDDELRGRL